MKRVIKLRSITVTLCLILVFALLGNSCLFVQGPAYTVTESDSGNEYQIEYDWSYDGQRWRYQAYIPVTVYDHFADEERPTDYRHYIYNETDDDWLGYTANSFRTISNDEEWEDIDAVNFIMSFVQNLPYEEDDISAGEAEWPRYPIETMVDCYEEGGVDCEDTVILLVSILRQMGYEVALLLYPTDKHMAAGVGVDSEFVNGWEGYGLTYYEQGGKIWAYCETTSPGWFLGQKDPDIDGEGTVIVLD